MNQEHLDGGTPTAHFKSHYAYDSNGNLDSLKRWGWNGTSMVQIDNFKYHYDDPTANNKLIYVNDAAGDLSLGDLADQYPYVGYDPDYDDDNNYAYDQIGELIQDKQEEIKEIEWKVTGKVHKITRASGSTKSNLEFVYDAMGNRIIKIERDIDDYTIKKTYYIRDVASSMRF